MGCDVRKRKTSDAEDGICFSCAINEQTSLLTQTEER
jgi:hypothetical protein